MNRHLTVYQCKTCGQRWIEEDYGEGEEFEKHLLAHCRMRHEQAFDKLRNLNTHKTIEACYTKTVYERLTKR